MINERPVQGGETSGSGEDWGRDCVMDVYDSCQSVPIAYCHIRFLKRSPLNAFFLNVKSDIRKTIRRSNKTHVWTQDNSIWCKFITKDLINL